MIVSKLVYDLLYINIFSIEIKDKTNDIIQQN